MINLEIFAPVVKILPYFATQTGDLPHLIFSDRHYKAFPVLCFHTEKYNYTFALINFNANENFWNRKCASEKGCDQ